MRVLLILSTLVAVTSCQDQATSCAVVLCSRGSSCRQVYNSTSGRIQAQCLDPNAVPSNLRECPDRQLSLLVRSGSGLRQTYCGRGASPCPQNFYCNVAPDDTYAYCCPEPAPTCAPCIKFCPFGYQLRQTGCGTCECVPTATTPIPKDGACPAVNYNRRPSGSCYNNCTVDSDCPSYLKCCVNGNGCNACVNPEPTNTCRNVKCRAGFRCEMKKVICKKQPCFPIPQCVADVTTLPPSSCETKKCPAGQRCVPSQIVCIRAPCPLSAPRCVPDPKGVCPPSSGLAGICIFNPEVNCLYDSECGSGELCCPEGCGKVCKSAVKS